MIPMRTSGSEQQQALGGMQPANDIARRSLYIEGATHAAAAIKGEPAPVARQCELLLWSSKVCVD